MTRDAFLSALERELFVLQPEERESALAYYREYLDEAGPEFEEEALTQLGSPESVAKRIIAEAGVPNAGASRWNAAPDYAAAYNGTGMPAPQPEASGGRVALTVVVMILTSPIWVALFVIWLAFVIAQGAVLAACCFTGIVAPIEGIRGLFAGMTSYAIFDIGVGLFFIGLVFLLDRPLGFLVNKGWKLYKKGFTALLNGLLGKENHA